MCIVSRVESKNQDFLDETEKINFGYCIFEKSRVSYRKRNIGMGYTIISAHRYSLNEEVP